MNYSNYDLIIDNANKQIKVYKYNNEIDNEHKKIFKETWENWETVDDDVILNVKELIAKYTDNNLNIYGYTTQDTITFVNGNIHYYIVFEYNDINIYYIEGTYSSVVDDSFEILLMMLSY